MDRSQLTGIVVTLLVLAALAWRLHGPREETPPPLAPPATSTPPSARHDATPTPTSPPVTQRLAGVALGATRYAVVEQPDGSTALYRVGDDVPGLGRIVDVTENSATFEGRNGRIHLNVKPPPSPTPAPATPTEAPPRVTESPPPGRSATGSPPSNARDRPAS